MQKDYGVALSVAVWYVMHTGTLIADKLGHCLPFFSHNIIFIYLINKMRLYLKYLIIF